MSPAFSGAMSLGGGDGALADALVAPACVDAAPVAHVLVVGVGGLRLVEGFALPEPAIAAIAPLCEKAVARAKELVDLTNSPVIGESLWVRYAAHHAAQRHGRSSLPRGPDACKLVRFRPEHRRRLVQR